MADTQETDLVREALFEPGDFNLASGKQSDWRINCRALSRGEWEVIAKLAVDCLPSFGSVEGVPRGGLPFADALKPHCTEGPLLIAEDVCTTGGSMEKHRNGRDAIGICAFQRGQRPVWAKAVFELSHIDRQSAKVEDVVARRMGIYRAKRDAADPLDSDTMTRFEAISHTIEAMSILTDEIKAALKADQ